MFETKKYRIKVKNLEQIKEKDYRSHPAQNQSYLKQLYDNPRITLEETKVNKGMELGSLVDALLFETYNDNYIVGSKSNISDTIKEIIELCYQKDPKHMSKDNILEAAKEVNYGQSWNDSTVVNKVIEGGNKNTNDGVEYHVFLSEAEGKTIISSDEYIEASFITDCIKENDKDLKDPQYKFQQGYIADIEISNKLTSELILKTKIKGLFDMFNEKVHAVKDYKIISGDPRWFLYNYFLKYKYYMQAGLYWFLALEVCKNSKFFTDRENVRFQFNVVNKNYPQYISKFPISYSTNIKAWDGFTYKDREYPGIVDCLIRSKFHTKHGFDAPMEIMKSYKETITLDE